MATLDRYWPRAPQGRRGWATGADRMLVVSVGTGTSPDVRHGPEPREMNLLFNAATIPSALMFAALNEQGFLCRAFGDCLAGDPLDREVGDMVGAVVRLHTAKMEASNAFCDDAVDAAPLFASEAPCWMSGRSVDAGRVDRVVIKPTGDWKDGGLPASPLGIAPGETPRHMQLAVPLRRSLWAGWFEPLVRIATDGGTSVQAVEMSEIPEAGRTFAGTFVAAGTGKLSLALNDAVTPPWLGKLPSWLTGCQTFYQNNKGTAEITVTEVGKPDEAVRDRASGPIDPSSSTKPPC